MAVDPESLSIDELTALLDALDAERLALRERARAVAGARNEKLRIAQAEARLGLHRMAPERAAGLRAAIVARPGVAEASGR